MHQPSNKAIGNLSATHVASKDHRDMQLKAFYAKLKKRPNGALEFGQLYIWKQQCKLLGITISTGNAVIRPELKRPKPEKPFNPEYARKCVDYLAKHGYLISPPQSQK